MKVLLAMPNLRWGRWDANTAWRQVPYALCLIAAVVEKDFDIRIVDCNFDDRGEADFAAAIREFGPDVVGLSLMMDHYAAAAHKAAEIVKGVSPRIVTVLGGVYATTNPARTIADPHLDYVVAGEGERVFPQLLRFLEGRAAFPAAGVWRKDGGKIVPAERAPAVMDLDALPLPAYHLVDFPRYGEAFDRNAVDRPTAFPYARIMTSRGCPGRCIFCQVRSIVGPKFRARSAAAVLKEISWLRERYGIRSLLIDDDNFFVDRGRAGAILRGLIASGWGMTWKIGNTAVCYLDDEMLGLMRESGCGFFNISIESGSLRVLREIIRKPQVDFAHAFRVVRKARELGINVGADFMIGFPGETWDEIRQTLRMAEELDADYVKIFPAMPLPGTELYELARATGSLAEGFDPEKIDWARAWIRTREFSPKDLTVLRAYEWDRINFTRPEKRRKIAEMMQVGEAELLAKRRQTLDRLDWGHS